MLINIFASIVFYGFLIFYGIMLVSAAILNRKALKQLLILGSIIALFAWSVIVLF